MEQLILNFYLQLYRKQQIYWHIKTCSQA